jgi:hypothetical protein
MSKAGVYPSEAPFKGPNLRVVYRDDMQGTPVSDEEKRFMTLAVVFKVNKLFSSLLSLTT